MDDRVWTTFDFWLFAGFLVGAAFMCWYAYRNRDARPVSANEIPELREKAIQIIDKTNNRTKDSQKDQVSEESNVEVLRVFVAVEGKLSLDDSRLLVGSLRQARLSFITNLRADDITVQHAEAYKKITYFQAKDTADNAALSKRQLEKKALLQREFLAYGLSHLDQVDAILRVMKGSRIYDLGTLKESLKRESA